MARRSRARVYDAYALVLPTATRGICPTFPEELSNDLPGLSGMANSLHSILAWKMPGTAKPGAGYSPWGPQRVGHD